MVTVRKDYAAPTGLEFCLGCSSTMMPRLRRYGSEGGWVMAVVEGVKFISGLIFDPTLGNLLC